MAVDQSLVGRSFAPTPAYQVTGAAVAAFAAAIGSDYHDGDPAPATFPIVVAFEAMHGLMVDPEVGISLHNVIHGEQRFVYDRPVVVGDRLTAELGVDSVRQIGGADIIATTSRVRDGQGAPVCLAKATLIHRSPEARPA